MTSGKLLRQLVKAAADGNKQILEDTVGKVIQEERQKQHHLLANDLERILYGMDRKTSDILEPTFLPVPEDKERHLELLEIKQPVRKLDDIVLSRESMETILRVIREQDLKEILKSHGLKPVQKILLSGPPGTGKTATAEALAYELNLPLVTVRIDSVISSYLGETAANLRKVFNFISTSTYVVLFDEFDALAKERTMAGDHGELKRVVNAFLQMLDSYKGESILLAATNHEQLLDSAIWRRFDELVEFQYLCSHQIAELLMKKLKGVRRDFEIEQAELIDWFKEKSPAEIERVLIRAIKDMVLSGKHFLSMMHIKAALQQDKSKR